MFSFHKLRLNILVFVLAFGQSFEKSLTSCELDTSYKFMSSRTNYALIGNSSSFSDYSLPNCQAIGLWHLSRHGNRYPEADEIQKMNDAAKKLQQSIPNNKNGWLCDEDLNRLKKWESRLKVEYDHLLTENGKEILRQLGSRMLIRLNDLFASFYNHQINVRVTSLTRTQQSAEHYLNGLLHFSSFRPSFSQVPDEDYLLKYPSICEKYLKTVGKNKDSCPESNKFNAESDLLKEYKKRFAQRIGVESSDSDTIENYFDATLKLCQYDYLIDAQDSIWCKFFDRETLMLLEYNEDLKYNCKYGFKYEINRMMTCDLMQNLVQALEGFKQRFETSDVNGKKIELLFSHSSTMLSFYGALGIGKDEKNFDFDNLNKINADRQYKISYLDPMNSNIAFILYKCNSNAKYVVRAFHNENLIKLEACKSIDCSLDEFVNFYKENLLNVCKSSREVCKVD